LFLSDVSPNIRYSSSFFAGKIIDEAHLIMRLLRLRQIEREDVAVCVLPTLVDKWTTFILDHVKLPLIW
jgi:hypothetical protein